MTDILIVGAGPAGLTAAVYARRAGMNVIVFDKGFYGGQAAITPEIENYPAIASITGPDFAQKLYDQALGLGAEIRFEEVKSLRLTGDEKGAVTRFGDYKGRTVILAHGVRRRHLECPGEEELLGKGVSYCATCDGAFFKEKDVAVVGGGSTALEDALFLAKYCRSVTLVHRRGNFRGEKPLVDAIAKQANITALMEHEVERIEGKNQVEALLLHSRGKEDRRRLPIAGVFIAIGYEADNTWLEGQLPLDPQGYIQSDETCTTSLPGVYVAGDNRRKPLRQIVTAAADGAVAAHQAASYLHLFE